MEQACGAEEEKKFACEGLFEDEPIVDEFVVLLDMFQVARHKDDF
jgi:hypothetical protein